MLRYFRAPELAFWTAVVAVLAAIAAAAAIYGHGSSAPRAQHSAVAAPSPATSQARTQVGQLVSLMPSGVAAGTNAGRLQAWATQMQTIARQGVTIRTAEGAATDDQLYVGLAGVAADAGTLLAHVTDPVAATSERTQIGLDVTHMHELVLGNPSPNLPDVGGAPLTQGPLSPATPAGVPTVEMPPTAAPGNAPGAQLTVPPLTAPTAAVPTLGGSR